MGNRSHMTGVASDQDSLTVVPYQVKEKYEVLIMPLALSSSISIAAMCLTYYITAINTYTVL